MQISGIQTEIKKVDVEVTDKELLSALKARVGVIDYTLNDEGAELGYWRDLSLERSNFEDLHWYCKSTDANLIEVFKSIEILESYILKIEN